MKYDIFISYRRDGGYITAKHLNDLLINDGYKVSFDIDTLRSGDFDAQLLERIDQCKDFILIVNQHCFDRTLDPDFDPKKDWLRCELAYALKKKKNIIPIFLAGVSGFPEGLPSDVVSVTKKNGPEYNRYYFNDFYQKLKKTFLLSKSHKGYRLFFVVCLVVILGVWMTNEGRKHYISNNHRIENIDAIGSYDRITPDKSYVDAKKLFINVVGRNPVYAVSYTEDTPILIGLVNDNVEEGDKPDSKYIFEPKMTLLRYHSENGVWMKDFAKGLNFDKIIDKDDACVYCVFDETSELYAASQQIYLYFHLYRHCGGNASANVTHDFIAINMMKGTCHFLEYVENLDSHYSDNGTLYKEAQYPKGIEDLLTYKFTEQSGLQKTNNSSKTDVETIEPRVSLHESEEVYSDAENIFMQWNADNPKRPDIDYLNTDTGVEPGLEAQRAYKEYVKQNYGEDHPRTAIVRLYDKCPQLSDGVTVTDHDVSSMRIQTGDFIVYSVWRGPVVAKNAKTGYWFVVWDEDYHYNTKYVRSDGDGIVTMEYLEVSDIDDNTDVIHYNLNTHKYYFAKERNTGVQWP